MSDNNHDPFDDEFLEYMVCKEVMENDDKDKYPSPMKTAGETICIPSGPDRSCTDRAIQKKHLNIYLRRTCFQSAIPPEGRDMRSGVCRGILCRTPF
mgnify:CR=1 FL=1